MSNIGLKTISLAKTSDINETNWIYPIEPWGHLMYSLNVEAVDDYANFFDKILSHKPKGKKSLMQMVDHLVDY
jgi:hypothetical protein